MPALLDQYGKPFTATRAQRLPAPPGRASWRRILARYDAAQTTDENMRHWAAADYYSADAANRPEILRKLRSRARYEVDNNSYCRSMVETLANDVVGTGPRVQILTGAGKQTDQRIEKELSQWMLAAGLAKRLRLLRKEKCFNGEGLGLLVNRPKLPVPVKLGLRTIECDQLSSPDYTEQQKNAVDGIRFDEDGEPLEYDILRAHPGDGWGTAVNWGKADSYEARDVIHVFRQDRSGQHRGVPEITPALPLFSQLRRYTLAVLAAAETAADFAAVIQTNQPPGAAWGQATDDSDQAFDVFELAQRMVTVLPEGYQLGQIKSEQPTTTYGEFKREILAEAFSSVMMPYAVGAGDSKDYNFASGKLDRRGYARAGIVERVLEWDPIVYRIVASWYLEARLVAGYLPELPPFAQWTVWVFWDEISEDINPLQAADASRVELESGQLSIPTMFARKGQDYETEQSKAAQGLGLTLAQYRKRLADKLLGAEQGSPGKDQKPRPSGEESSAEDADSPEEEPTE
ncbi:MAG: phage portal protein [Phycisphaerae bacterium]|nr:phage portal protein [Phycisphaerae bacterium]